MEMSLNYSSAHFKVGFFFLFLLLLNNSEAQGLWIKKASFPGEARHRCTGFSIGNKGYVGGGHFNSGYEATFADYWEYDPSTDSWTQIADFGGGPRYHSAAFTIGDVAYVGGGEDAHDNYTSDFWKYVPLVNAWFPVADLPGEPRRGSTSFVINDTGYVGLGQSDAGYEIDFYRYNVTEDSWDTIADFIGSGRSGAVGFDFENKGYVATGHEMGSATKDFYSYDAPANTWLQLADVDTTLRQDATGFTLLGKGYVLTGNDTFGEDNYDDVWEYDFESNTWTRLSDFPGDARRYFVSFVIGDRAFGCGGTDGTNLKDLWEFDPTFNDLSEQMSNHLSFWPNPAREKLTIELNHIQNSSNYKLHIRDLSGQLIYTQEKLNHQEKIDLSEFHKGTYVVQFFIDGHIVQNEKLIVIR